MMEVPNADQHRQVEKVAFLNKLSGRSFPYMQQWKRRYCVLSQGKLFYYEKKESRGSDKGSGVINLEYFDKIEEAPPKESKKATHVFVITSLDRSLFDPGRHYFSASSAEDMKDWIGSLKASLDLIRNNNRPKRVKGPPPADDTDEVDGPLAKRKESQKTKSSSRERRRKEETESSPPISPRDSTPPSEPPPIDKKPSANEIKPPDRDPPNGKLITLIITPDEVPPSDGAPQGEEEERPLESITKHRVRGPRGRRAPQGKRGRSMKQKAHSLSALQNPQSGEDDSREVSWSDKSPEIHEPMSSARFSGPNTSQPVLAYCYSSDEDDDFDFDKATRSTDSGRAGMVSTPPPPTPPPRSASYMVDQFHSFPRPSRRTKIDSFNEIIISTNGQSLTSLPEEGNAWIDNVWGAAKTYPSLGISSGKASPAMDLDNMLMNQSVQAGEAIVETCSNPDGSEVSTFRPNDHEQEIDNLRLEASKAMKHVQKVSSALHCMHHRIVDLDQNMHGLESSYCTSKIELNTLQETLTGLRGDTEKVADAVARLSHEASKASKQILSSNQETEEVLQKANCALIKAAKAKEEHERAKREYELLSKEVKLALKEIKLLRESRNRENVLLQTNMRMPTENEVQITQNKENRKEIRKTKSTDSSEPFKNGSGEKSGQKEPLLNNKTGYQSFFQRPSSLIYGLTNRSSLSKSGFLSETTTKKDKENKVEKETDGKQKEKEQGSLELKHKEKRHYESSVKGKSDITGFSKKAETFITTSTKGSQTGEAKRAISNLSLEHIPLMDEIAEHSGPNKSKISSFNNPIYNMKSNFYLEKSLSSPTVSHQTLSSRPRAFAIELSGCKGIIGHQNQPSYSPESPVRPTSPLNFGSSSSGNNVPNNLDNAMESSAMSSLYRPVSGSLVRQSSMTTVPEDHAVPQISRLGTFAISRQSSSPNLPLQRQNSTPTFPLQRQNSLGTVPEEGQLPRQLSLLSVPEERPIADRTLPLSPSSSMISFPISTSSSSAFNVNHLNGIQNSMETVTGPILASSHLQEMGSRQPFALISVSDLEDEPPFATSTLKKGSDRKKNSSKLGVVV